MLDYGSEDIDGMDDDADKEQGQDPPSLDVGRPPLRTMCTWLTHLKSLATMTKKIQLRINLLRHSLSTDALNAALSHIAATLASEKIVLRTMPKTMKTLLEQDPNRRNKKMGKPAPMNRPCLATIQRTTTTFHSPKMR